MIDVSIMLWNQLMKENRKFQALSCIERSTGITFIEIVSSLCSFLNPEIVADQYILQ